MSRRRLNRWLVIDATAITGLDFSAVGTVAELQHDLADLAKAGVTLALVALPKQRHVYLKRMELLELIGARRIFESRHACVAAYKLECLKDDLGLPAA